MKWANNQTEYRIANGEGDGDETFENKEQTSHERADSGLSSEPQLGHGQPRSKPRSILPRGKGPEIKGDYYGPPTLHYQQIDPCIWPEKLPII
jgi:hypothetical protein